ncbi:cofactor assembly of complex C subunit B [Geitlerinema sp. PCC 7407]|uniref:cofactor assembly of complex C subunit B n=1 Tax=Geitlerinema sp. PCC 7407 TaxID=1173025 RepID=UPI00029FCAE2|nr:cofactor assembly of complex C subunit B [Geitlerinema sp. PCC 7407]AFY67365.1 hypothetical protein GEI7407_2894 [Geitlerinema sp. PCC 7407]
MDFATLPSTLFLTVLLSIGLFFFIRASVKDRTQSVALASEQPEEVLMPQLRQYFAQRAYQVTSVDKQKNQVTFEGFVRPSRFLAGFLTLLAALGMLCLALVLSMVLPQVGLLSLGLVALAPLAGWFYWQRAGRPEQVSLRLQAGGDAASTGRGGSILSVTAHRDELLALQEALSLEPQD